MNPLGTFLQNAGYNSVTASQGDFRLLLVGIIQIALSLVGTIFFLLILYGGFIWFTAAGNNEKVTKARTIIITAILGFIITLLALTISRFIVGVIEGAGRELPGTNPQVERLF